MTPVYIVECSRDGTTWDRAENRNLYWNTERVALNHARQFELESAGLMRYRVTAYWPAESRTKQ